MEHYEKGLERSRGVLDHSSAVERVADYLRREQGMSDSDAARRADEIVRLLGDGASGSGGVLGGGALGIGGGVGLAGAGVLAAVGGVTALIDNWWLFALRGVLALLFGLFAAFMPFAALGAFVLIFGVWAFIDGIHALALAVTGWRSWQLVLVGLVGIAVGFLTFFRPGITALGLYAAIAAWSIARGVLEIAVAVELRKQVEGEWWLVLGGIASIVFGVLMVALPAAGVLALAWLIGIYALTFGVIMLVLSGRLYRLAHPSTHGTGRGPRHGSRDPRSFGGDRTQPA